MLFKGYSEEMTDIGIGLLLTVVGATQLFTQTYLRRRMVRRFGEGQLVVIGSILRTIGMAVYALITTPWLGPLGSLFFATGYGIANPPLQSMAISTVADQDRGGVLGLFQSSVNLSTIISTAIAGMLFTLGPTIPYWAGAAMSFVVVLPAIGLMRRTADPAQQHVTDVIYNADAQEDVEYHSSTQGAKAGKSPGSSR